jgi:hypothetical protein
MSEKFKPSSDFKKHYKTIDIVVMACIIVILAIAISFSYG